MITPMRRETTMRIALLLLLALAGCGGADNPTCDDGRDYCGNGNVCCPFGWYCGGPANEDCVPACYGTDAGCG
jgi:hypothetical protein